jgi:hypothetical protein
LLILKSRETRAMASHGPGSQRAAKGVYGKG